MKVRNAARWAPRGARPWLFATIALVIASTIRILIHPLVGPIMPGTAFFIAAALIEYFFGLGPAIAVMTLGLGIADYLFVPPYQTIGVLDQSDLTLIISYPIITALVICLIERLRRAQFRAELIARVAQSRYEMLLRIDNERALAKRAIDETHRLLRHLPHHHNDIILIKAFDRKPVSGDAPTVAEESSATAPGRRFANVHEDDLRRLLLTTHAGSERIRIAVGGTYQMFGCIVERFTTHAGDFLVARVEEQS
jgi:K+-sensing histidine kinase KdpD